MRVMNQELQENAHEIVGGRLFVSATELPRCRCKVVSNFRNNEEVRL